eukprot:COSAG02_NODE_3853_length_6144_cov_137.748056_3_plen_127_part_00
MHPPVLKRLCYCSLIDAFGARVVVTVGGAITASTQVQFVHRMRHGGLGRSARDGLTQDRGDPDRGRASTGRGEMPTVVFLNSFARFRDAVMDAITAADWVGVTCEVLILNTIAGLSDPLRRAGCKS